MEQIKNVVSGEEGSMTLLLDILQIIWFILMNEYLDSSLSESHDKIQDVNQEFVSEDYDTSAVSMDDIRREIEQLTVPKTNPTKAGSPGK